MVDFEVYDQAGNVVWQRLKSQQALTAEQQSFSLLWVMPECLPGGLYTLPVGVFSPDWGNLYGWDDGMVALTVG